jgi:RNA recognition motif-containing protein
MYGESTRKRSRSRSPEGRPINFNKDSLQKIPAAPQSKPLIKDCMPNMQSFQDNAQAANIMLLNNANPKPGQAMDEGMLERLLSEHQPSCLNISGVPEFFKNFFMVREVWIGNISPATDKQLLYDAFKNYGVIEGIEMFSSKGFAFIKYRKVVCATRAYELADGIVVDGRPVKVAFADPTRRIDIVGDSLSPENPNFNPIDDDNFKNLFLGYSHSAVVPPEAKLREVFSRYGRVKRISIRQATSTTRPYAFVDFEKGEQASESRKRLYIEDYDGQRRKELGDPALEISFKNTNNIVSKNGVKNGVRYQDNITRQEVSELAKRLMEKPAAFVNLLKFQTLFTVPNFQLAPSNPYNFSIFQPPSTTDSTAPVKEEENPNIGSVVWSGFITRSKNYRVGIDATLVEGNGDCFPATQYHINISHRVQLSEVFKFERLAIVTLDASNETQQEAFQEYVKYFSQKQRAGYVGIKNALLYICPPLEQIKNLYTKLEDTQLLGVFVDPAKKIEKVKDTSKLEELIDLLQRPEVIKHFESRHSGAAPSDPRLNLQL